MAIVLTVGGINISSQVYVTQSNFVSNAGPMPGMCQIAVKDPSLVQAFTIGDRILLAVDGLNKWAGYLTKIQRTYPFDAYSPPSIRNFVLHGVEIGILFQRRWVYKQSDPTQDAPDYPANTQDTEILADLFDDWLRLGGDDLDLTTKVHNLGVFAEDQKGSPIYAGMPWMTTMNLLASRLAPVWGINADRQLIWADVDQESAPFGISDHPGAGEIGCKNLAILFDATEMINDALVIGAGGGSPVPVYSREIADASVEEHGTWQMGMVAYSVYKQATVNQIADSWVHGSSTSRRGHKNDRVSATCTIWENGFRPGMVVHLESGVWGWSDDIPIRSMRISWPATTVTRYDLTLSHELDTPMNLTDPTRLADLGGGGGTHTPEIPIIDIDPPPPIDECTDEFCGITDTFQRLLPSGWGFSDAGVEWGESGYFDGTGEGLSVDGSSGVVVQGGYADQTQRYQAQATTELFTSFSVNTTWIDSSSTLLMYVYRSFNHSGPYDGPALEFSSSGSASIQVLGDGVGTVLDTAPFFFNFGDVIHLHVRWEGGRQSASVWMNDDPEPSTWMVESGSTSYVFSPARDTICLYVPSAESAMSFHDFNIVGVNRCGATQFDNFNRTVSAGWGTATPGGQVWLIKTTEIFGINASWKYLVGAHGHSPGFEAPGFNDAGWSIGNGAFGLNWGTSYVITTAWPENTTMCLRRNVTIPADADVFNLIFGVDNFAAIYWNGAYIGEWQRDTPITTPTDHIVSIPGFTPGATGVLAVRCRDVGIATYFGMAGSTGGVALSPATTVGVDAEIGGWLSLPAGAYQQQLHIPESGPWVAPKAFTFKTRFTIDTMPSSGTATILFATGSEQESRVSLTWSLTTATLTVTGVSAVVP